VSNSADKDRAIFMVDGSLILASGSPRRQEMLTGLGLSFNVRVSQVEEQSWPGESAENFVKRLSQDKAMAVAIASCESWVLAADTAVVIDEQILGKPAGDGEATEMLLRLAGHWHEVWTGFCIVHYQKNILVAHAVRTNVRFFDWPEEVCRAYVKTGDPMDKAGAYGIQGVGGFMVQEISGSYSNVVGLPLAEVLTEMRRLGAIHS